MYLELNEVDDGFIRRWLEQSLDIIMRNPLAWIFLMCVLGVSSIININVFLKSFIGLWFMLAGLELSIASDLKQKSFKSFINILKKASEGMLIQVYFKMIFYTLMFALFIIVKYTGDFQNANEDHFWLTDVYWLYGLGLISLAGIGFQVYTHLYSRFFDSLDKRTVNYNCKLAAKINYKVDISLTIFIVFNITIVGMFFPLLIIMLYPITCCLIYVSFKEIFLKKSHSRIPSALGKEIKTFETNNVN
jgi:hypothetical protein